MANNINLFNAWRYAKRLPNVSAQGEPGILEKSKRVLTFSAKPDCLNEIEYFKEILLGNQFIEIGSAHSSEAFSPQSKEVFGKPTLYGLIGRLKTLIKHPRENYNIDPKTFKTKHQKEFEDLIEALTKEIEIVSAHKNELPDDATSIFTAERHLKKINGRFYIQIGNETKALTECVLNKIYELNYTKRGFLQAGIDFTKNPPPMLVLLDQSLQQLHTELLKYPPNPKALKNHYQATLRSLSAPEKLLPGFKPKSEDLQLIEELKTAFENHFLLPESLKKDERFSPSYYELNLHLNRLKNLITTKMNQSLPKTKFGFKVITKVISGASYSLLSNAFPESFKKTLTYFSGTYKKIFSSDMRPDQNKPHPLIVFYDALDFFQKNENFYGECKKQSLLKELFAETVDNFPELHTPLMTIILASQVANDSDQAVPTSPFERLDLQKLNSLQEVLEIEIKKMTSTLDEETSSINRIYKLTQTPLPGHEKNDLKTYIENILKLLNCNESGLLKKPVKMIAGSLKYFLDQALSMATKAKDKKKLLQIKTQINTVLESALTEDTIEGYKQAFSKVLDSYNKHQIYFGFVELPNTLEETESSDVPDEILTSALASIKEATFEKKSQKILEADLKKQQKALGRNTTHFLLFEVIYYNILGEKKSETTEKKFYSLVKKLNSDKNKKSVKKLFIKDLKELIDNSSKGYFKKRLAKFFLGKLTYSLVHESVNSFTEKLLTYLRKNLTHLEGSPLEPLNPRIVETLDECSAQYQLMLEKWSEIGGNKERTIRKLMKESTYNVGIKGSYSEEDLYKCVSKASTKAFVDGLDVRKPWKDLSKSYHNFITLKGPFDSFTKKVKAVAKVFFAAITYIPLIPVFYLGLAVLSLVDKILSFALIHYIRHSLEQSKTIETLVDSIQDSVYKKNPYVDIITDFLIDNLEEMSIILHNESIKKQLAMQNESVSYDREKDVKIPPRTRAKLSQAIQNCFQMLDKNKFKTSDQLKQALRDKNNPSMMVIKSALEESLDQQILPEVIESLIDVIAISSDGLFKKKHLDKQLYRILEQMNTSLSSPKKQRGKNLKKLNQLYYQNETHLLNLWDKVTKKIISNSVEDKFSRFGDRNYRETENQKVWIQNQLLPDPENQLDHIGLLRDWKTSVSDLALRKKEILDYDVENLHFLKKTADHLKLEVKSFIAQLSLRFEKIKKSSLSKRSLHQLNKQLEQLSKDLNLYTENGVLKLYRNSQFLSISKHDLKNTAFLTTATNQISSQLEHISNDQVANSMKIVSNITTYFERALGTLNEIKKDPRHTVFEKEFCELLDFFTNSDETKVFLKELELIKTNLNKQHKIKTDIHETFSALFNVKKRELKAKISWKNRFEYRKNRPEKNSKKLYNELKAQMTSLFENSQDASGCLAYLEEVYKKTDISSLERSLQHYSNFQKELLAPFLINDQSLNLIKTALIPINLRTENLLEEAKSKDQDLKNEFKSLIDDNDEGSLNALLTRVENTTKELKSIEHIHIPIKALDSVRKATEALVYSRVKPRADAAMSLLKEENFALFALNHFALIPLKESKHGK